MTFSFNLPDIGEGVAEGEILKWMVKVGDHVKEDQPLVEIMTDKVNVQLPSPRTGTVASILVKEGDVAKVGQTIMTIDDGSVSSPTTFAAPSPAPSAPPATQTPPPQAAPSMVLAAPATRRLARELGVDLASVRGTGPQGRVTDDDVKAAAAGTPRAPAQLAQTVAPPSPGSREEVVPIRGIRKSMAERMLKSMTTTAQLTHVDEVDMTELVLLRDAFKGSAEKRGVKLTYLPFVIKALIPALKEFPYLNSSVDDQGANMILKKYYNIGIATDTPQGLVVPVVKDADTKDIFELAAEIERLANKARQGQLTLDEIRGSTFTITNMGAVGGLFATPIVNLPEVAILGLHKIAKRPVVREGRIEVRDTTYISLSFDHRVIDGAYAARFTNKLIDTMQDTKKLLAEAL